MKKDNGVLGEKKAREKEKKKNHGLVKEKGEEGDYC